MVINMDTEKIERYKATAEIFLRKDIPVFVKDVEDNLYFGNLIFVGEDSIRIECFGPEQRKGLRFTIYWPLILDFDEYEVKA